MKKVILTALSALLFCATAVQAKEVQVKAYTKKDGTKVAAYTKTVKDKVAKVETKKEPAKAAIKPAAAPKAAK